LKDKGMTKFDAIENTPLKEGGHSELAETADIEVPQKQTAYMK